MRLDFLKIEKFKNLKGFEIDFDESQLSTVLIGDNGSGKSNVIEALVIIFRDLDFDKKTSFNYFLRYACKSHTVEIDHGLEEAGKKTIKIDGYRLTLKDFREGKNRYLPNHVFGYYSGAGRRMEVLFDDHQTKYYSDITRLGVEEEANRSLPDMRRLFYCREQYGQLALLTYFAFDSPRTRKFLKENLGISGFESSLMVLREPRWSRGSAVPKGRRDKGDPNYWYAAGMVRKLLSRLWSTALAPIRANIPCRDDYREKARIEEHLYQFIQDDQTLKGLAKSFGDQKAFFTLLESMDIADLIREVRIWVEMDNGEGELPFHEISDGQKQLLSVLGLMEFTGDEETLFLLDEPDTHLNPKWKWEYLQYINAIAGKKAKSSHIILTSHDPLTICALEREQVQVMYQDENNVVRANPPRVSPRGLGFTSILTQIFGLHTTLDAKTQKLLDERNSLLRLKEKTDKQTGKLENISRQLKELGFMLESRDPMYEKFLRAVDNYKASVKGTLSPEEMTARSEVAKRIIAEIMEKKGVAS